MKKYFDVDTIHIKQNKPYYIVDGNDVGCFRSNGENIIMAWANCKPTDKFDLGFGKKLALARLNGDYELAERLIAEKYPETDWSKVPSGTVVKVEIVGKFSDLGKFIGVYEDDGKLKVQLIENYKATNIIKVDKDYVELI